MKDKKQILLALCGLTPQIITETLYCLFRKENIDIKEIWLVTTTSGKEAAERHLLNPKNGKYYQFCKEYDIDYRDIDFSCDHILSADKEYDISTREANEAFANLLTEKVWDLTKDPDNILHCSIAGGRKTMSAYLAMIMQFFARENDKLYHVLLNPPPLENNPELQAFHNAYIQ